MPDSEDWRAEFVSEAFDRWWPRYLNAGLIHSDLRTLERRIDSWSKWIDEFAVIAETHEQLGESAKERGDTESLAEHFRRAALYLHFGSHVWHDDEDRRRKVHERASNCFERVANIYTHQSAGSKYLTSRRTSISPVICERSPELMILHLSFSFPDSNPRRRNSRCTRITFLSEVSRRSQSTARDRERPGITSRCRSIILL